MKHTILITLLGLALGACSQINTGEIGIKTSFGKVDAPALAPGLYFYFPGVSNIQRLNTKVQTVEQDSQAASSDLQTVQTQLTLNYHLGTQDPIGHYTRLGADQSQIEISIVKPAMSEAFKASVAQYTAEELITKREVVSRLIQDTLAARLKQYDLYVDSISITNFQFSAAYSAAIEAKQVAAQNVQKAENDYKTKKIEADMLVLNAKAVADSMALQRQSITPELIEMEKAKKWDGKLPIYVTSGAPLPFMSMGK